MGELLRKEMSQQTREQDWRYFSIQSVAINKGEEVEEATSRRQREWLAQLKLTDLTFIAWKGEERCMHGESKARRTVCSDYCVNGMLLFFLRFCSHMFYNLVLSPAV